MAFSSKLASLFVEFVLKGQLEMKAALEANKAQLQAGQKAAESFGAAASSMLVKATTAIRTFALSGGDSAKAVAGLTASIKSTETQLGSVKAAAKAFTEESANNLKRAAAAVVDLQQKHAGLIAVQKAAQEAAAKYGGGLGKKADTSLADSIAQTKKQLGEAQAAAKLFGDQHAGAVNKARDAVLSLAEKLKTMRGLQQDAIAGAAKTLGGSIGDKYNTAADMLQQTLAKKLAPAVALATDKMVQQIAKVQGLSAAQTQALKTGLDWNAGLGKFQEKLTAVGTQIQNFANGARVAFVGLTGAVLGWVTAGISLSSVGQRLQFFISQLARTIAGVFRPEIEAVISGIQRLTNWIRGLSNEQKENIARWTMLAAGALFAVAVLPKLISVVSALSTAMKVLQVATGLGAGPIVAIVAGLGAALAGLASSKGGQTALAALGKAVLHLGESIGKMLEGVARLLGPIIIPMINALARGIEWLARVLDSTVFKWIALVAGFATLILMVPKIVSGILAIAEAIRAWAVATASLKLAAFAKDWKTAAAAIGLALGATAAVYLADKALAAQKAKDKAAGDRGELPLRSTGFEDVTQAYRRVAAASINVGTPQKDKQQQQIDQLVIANRKLGAIQDEIAKQRMPVK